MKWRNIEQPNLYEWHKWFAWYPVAIGLKKVWLEWVLRKKWSNPLNYADNGYNYKNL